MSDAPEPIIVPMDDDASAPIRDLISGFHKAVAASSLDRQNPNFLMIVAGAAAQFAGMQFGIATAIGLAPPQHQRRFVETVAANAREGIKTGQRMTARHERERFGGGVQ